MWVYRYTTVAVQWNIYVQCGNHICSVIYVKYVYSAHCHMVDCIDFICGIYMCIHLPYKYKKICHLWYIYPIWGHMCL